jgi:D-alanyl-D-alanine carboxypeptidase
MDVDLAELGRLVARRRTNDAYATAIALRIDGGLVHGALFDADGNDLGARDVRFSIFSITKTLTALCALRLQEQGQLDIERPLSHWRPELPFPPSLTLAEVLRHRGGLPDYGPLHVYHDAVRERPSQPWSEQQFLDVALVKGLLFAPGMSFAYSNIGYLLVRQIIEQVTGSRLREVLAEHVARPLSLQNTFVAEQIGDWATCIPGHGRDFGAGDSVDVRALYHPGWCAPGVAVSTVEDTTLIFDRLLAGELLGEAALARMLELIPVPGHHPPAVTPSYGLGLMGDPGSPRGPNFGHAGGGPGYRVVCTCLPSTRLGRVTVAAFCNSSEASDVQERADDVISFVLGS